MHRKLKFMALGLGCALFWAMSGSSALGVPAEVYFPDDTVSLCEKLHRMPTEQLSSSIENSVTANSREYLARGLNRYALDVRYANTLGRICASISPFIPRAYANGNVSLLFMEQLPQVQGSAPYTASNLGKYTPTKNKVVICSLASSSSYGAYTYYRTIMIDSFMLDALYRVAQYRAYSGNYDNTYEQVLAGYAAEVGQAPQANIRSFPDISRGLLMRSGVAITNPFLPFDRSYECFGSKSGLKWEALSFHSIDRDGVKWANPAHIPLPMGYDADSLDREAGRNFERLIAPILCRKLSHCLLDHNRIRLEKAIALRGRLNNLGDASEAESGVRRFLYHSVIPQQEREAVIYGAQLGRMIGLRVQDFEEGFWFESLIEKSKGLTKDFESNPQYVERRRLVEKAFLNEI